MECCCKRKQPTGEQADPYATNYAPVLDARSSKERSLAIGRAVAAGICIITAIVALFIPWFHAWGTSNLLAQTNNTLPYPTRCDVYFNAFYLFVNCDCGDEPVDCPNKLQSWLGENAKIDEATQRFVYISCWLAVFVSILAMLAIVLFRWSRFHWFSIMSSAIATLSLTYAVGIFLLIGLAMYNDNDSDRAKESLWPYSFSGKNNLGALYDASYQPWYGYYTSIGAFVFAIACLVFCSIPRQEPLSNEEEWRELLRGEVDV